MRRFLMQPYPFGYNVGRKLRVCAGIGLFVALFLGVFKPFGIHLLSPAQQWQHPLLFGLVTFVASASLQVGLPRVMPRLFDEARWKSWKELLFVLVILLFTAAGNYWLMQALYGQQYGERSFWGVLIITAQVGIFPLAFIITMKQALLYRRFSAEAAQVNNRLDPPEPQAVLPQSPPTIVLQGEGQNERLELSADALLFITSSDNYVQVVWETATGMRSQLVRCPLKSMEAQLASDPRFFRCHRMCLVNLGRVAAVSGNAQGLRLHLQGTDTTIPVSRSLTQTVKDRLAQPSHSPQIH
jgi:hypothetical protein